MWDIATMHFVARNTTENAYQGQGYSLRPDPLTIFRQPPMHLSRPNCHGGPNMHRRNASTGLSLFKSSDNEDGTSTPLLPIIPKYEDIDNNWQIDERYRDHDCEETGCKRVVLNIAGQKYETQIKTLNRLPSTLLGDKEKRQKYWDPKRNEFFFDRYRPAFPAILYYYQSGGRMKRPVEVPFDIFLEELEFFELGKSVIDQLRTDEGFPQDDVDNPDEEVEDNLRHKIWTTFEMPGSSVLSVVVAIISVIFILASIVTYCMETLPQFKNADCINITIKTGNESSEWKVYPNFKHPLFVIESACIAWFIFELVMRTACCPSFIKFAKQLMNLIDFLSILPYFTFLLIFFISSSCDTNSKFLAILRVLRVVRIFKLGRFSEGLQILGKTLQTSMRELSMFLLFLGIGVVIFSGAIYYAEAQTKESFFTSIPGSFWWAVISMTTVGYGDVYPITLFGKLIGGACVLSGLLAIALPVPVIVTNFNNIYRQTTGRGSNL